MTEELSKLQARPESCDIVVFGDVISGEVWITNEIEENGKPFIIMQWEPEQAILNFLKNTPKGGDILDKETGRTITRKYPKSRVFYRISEKRYIIFTDWLGKEEINYDVDKRIIEENEGLKYENRSLRNQVGYLKEENRKLQADFDETLKTWRDRVASFHPRYDRFEQPDDSPQAGYMDTGQPQ